MVCRIISGFLRQFKLSWGFVDEIRSAALSSPQDGQIDSSKNFAQRKPEFD
jgi:hypothetical protein